MIAIMKIKVTTKGDAPMIAKLAAAAHALHDEQIGSDRRRHHRRFHEDDNKNAYQTGSKPAFAISGVGQRLALQPLPGLRWRHPLE